MTKLRIGQGYDVHRLVEVRDLILGGVKVPYEKGLLGHSDADVLLHAIMDALLGAAAMGDIGKLFPDSDPAFKGASSVKLLQEVGRRLAEAGYGGYQCILWLELHSVAGIVCNFCVCHHPRGCAVPVH